MNRKTELIRADDIIIEDRLREDYGDIDALAESIQTTGLIHPITIDQENKLVAGERRLQAMKQLGYVEVECRRFHLLSDNEKRIIELEENTLRKDLTPYERSKNITELAAKAEIVDRETGEILDSGCTNLVQLESTEQRPQRLPQPGSTRRVAERIGLPHSTVEVAKKHVAAAESYRFLQGPDWSQSKAMEAERILNSLPEKDRPVIEAMVSEPGIPADRASAMLRNIAGRPDKEREGIIRLAHSDDPRDRTLAKTKAAEVPPMPDPRYLVLYDAANAVRKAIKMFPNDPEVFELEQIHGAIVGIRESLKKDMHSGTQDAAD